MARGKHPRRPSNEGSERLERRLLLTSSALDPGYGQDGVTGMDIKVYSRHNTASSRLSAKMPDGSLVIATGDSLYHILTDGSYDTEFGNYNQTGMQAGLFIMPESINPNDNYYIASLDVDSSGDIYMAWNTSTSDNQIVIAKISSTGDPVSTYGTDNGWLFYTLTDKAYADISDIAVASDDTLLVLGAANDSKGQSTFFVMDFTSDGATSGSFTPISITPATNFTSNTNYWTSYPVSLAIDGANNDIYVGCNNAGAPQIYRYLSDGTLDTTYNTTGMVQMPVTRRYITDMVVDSSSRLLVAACYSTNASSSYQYGSIYRLTAAGSLDPQFGTDGVATADNSVSNAKINSLDFLSDGSILAGLYGQFGALHFSRNGVFDSTFDLSGELDSSSTGWTFGAYSADDGKILLAGSTQYSYYYYIPVAARLVGNGLIKPVAQLTLPNSAAEDETIDLTATIDTIPNQPIIYYQWDLDYNGSNFIADITGASAHIDPWTFNGPSSHLIALRVIDSQGIASDIVTQTLDITNSAPVASVALAFDAQDPIFINTPVPFDLSSIDAPGDIVSRWSVSWGDGKTQLFVNRPTSLTHSYAQGGTYSVTVTVRDNNDATSAQAVMAVKVYTCPQIEGTVYLDNNVNGVKNSADAGMSGVVVWLDENNNGVLDNSEHSATTDAQGHYYLIDLPTSSSSKFRVQIPDGYRNSTAKAYDAGNLPDDQTLKLNFGLTNRASIVGKIFQDENANHRLDGKDRLLSQVRLYIDANNNGVLDYGEKSVLTNKKGEYRFNNVVGGRYRIRAVLPKALKSLYNGTPRSDWWINLDMSKAQTNKNFYFVD